MTKFKQYKGWVYSILYLALIISCAILEIWWGFWGLIGFSTYVTVILIVRWFKYQWKDIKEMIISTLRIYEINQVGRTLDDDDDYWKDHKKPTMWQLIRGTYVPTKKDEKK